MYNIKMKLSILSLIIIMFLNFLSCEKEKSPTEPVIQIPENLFPLQVGRYWKYKVTETDTIGEPIRSGWSSTTVIAQQVYAGKNAYVLVDSLTMMQEYVVVDTNYFHIDETGNIWSYILLESMDPSSGPGWLMLFNRKKGLNQLYNIMDSSIMLPGLPISVRIKLSSIIKEKTSIVVPEGSYNNSYPAELKMEMIAEPSFYVSLLSQYWLVPNVGLVKLKESIPASGDFGSNIYYYRIKELVYKNF